jgi:HAD superfamily hydrolase (TIGR01509 family)
MNLFCNEVDLIPGVEHVFSMLAELHIPMGLVSSTEKINIEKKMTPLKRKGIKDAFSSIITIDDAPRKKPAPDPLIACANALKVDPRKCMYVGDSHIDIQAGKAAGMLTAGVLTGLDDYDTLSHEKPTFIFESVADLCNLFEK